MEIASKIISYSTSSIKISKERLAPDKIQRGGARALFSHTGLRDRNGNRLEVKDLEHVPYRESRSTFSGHALGACGDRCCLDRGASSPCVPTTYTFIAAVTRKEHAGIEKFDHLPIRSEDRCRAGFIIFAGRRYSASRTNGIISSIRTRPNSKNWSMSLSKKSSNFLGACSDAWRTLCQN